MYVVEFVLCTDAEDGHGSVIIELILAGIAFVLIHWRTTV